MAPRVDGSDIDERAISTVTAHLRPLAARITVARHDHDRLGPKQLARESGQLISDRDAKAVLWIHIADDNSLVLYLADREQVLSRKLRLEKGRTSAGLEALANAAGSAVAALLDGQRTGLTPVEAAPAPAPSTDATETTTTARKTTAARPPRRGTRPSVSNTATSGTSAKRSTRVGAWPRLGLSAGYVGNTFSRRIAWQSGVGFGASYAFVPRAHFTLGYDVVVPSRVTGTMASVQMRRHPISLAGGYRLPLSERWELPIDLRGSVELVDGVVSDVSGRRPDHRLPRVVLGTIGPRLGLGVRIAKPVRLRLLVGVDVVLGREQFRTRFPGATGPEPVRFTTGLGLDFGLLRR